MVAGDGPARTLTCERNDARPQRRAQPGGGVIESKAPCSHDPGMSAIAPAAIRRMGRGATHGSAPRATAHPTTEAMLRGFKNIYLNFVTVHGQTYQHLTPLSKLQCNILRLLDLPASIYTRLDVESANPP